MSDTVVSSGQTVSGLTVTVGFMIVESGGIAIDTTVISGGVVNLFSGAVANSTILSGTENVFSGAVADATSVFSGGASGRSKHFRARGHRSPEFL